MRGLAVRDSTPSPAVGSAVEGEEGAPMVSHVPSKLQKEEPIRRAETFIA